MADFVKLRMILKQVTVFANENDNDSLVNKHK